MPVFLYNYSDRTLHGIYKAVSEGDLEINPRGALQCLWLCCLSMARSWLQCCSANAPLQVGPHSPTSARSIQRKFVLKFTTNVLHWQKGMLLPSCLSAVLYCSAD